MDHPHAVRAVPNPQQGVAKNGSWGSRRCTDVDDVDCVDQRRVETNSRQGRAGAALCIVRRGEARQEVPPLRRHATRRLERDVVGKAARGEESLQGGSEILRRRPSSPRLGERHSSVLRRRCSRGPVPTRNFPPPPVRGQAESRVHVVTECMEHAANDGVLFGNRGVGGTQRHGNRPGATGHRDGVSPWLASVRRQVGNADETNGPEAFGYALGNCRRSLVYEAALAFAPGPFGLKHNPIQPRRGALGGRRDQPEDHPARPIAPRVARSASSEGRPSLHWRISSSRWASMAPRWRLPSSNATRSSTASGSSCT